jgi:hypothetical protein
LSWLAWLARCHPVARPNTYDGHRVPYYGLNAKETFVFDVLPLRLLLARGGWRASPGAQTLFGVMNLVLHVHQV